MACSQLIRTIKVTSELNVIVENGLTLSPGYLRLGGPLVMDTEITGNFGLFLGTGSSRLREFAIRSNGQVSIQSGNGVATSGIQLDNNGILVIDTNLNPDGILGSEDFSANYNPLNYVQKVYVDKKVVGKNISALLAGPLPAQNGFSITWDDVNQVFTLSPSGGALAGADTQVIYNSGGALVGSDEFTFSSSSLKVPHINIGTVTPFAGINRRIQVIADEANKGLELIPKGNGDVVLSVLDGRVIIGDGGSTRTVQQVLAIGANAQVDLALEPKGTDGVVYIGNAAEAGAYRYLQAAGNNLSVNLIVKGKGDGSVIIDSVNATIPTYIGSPTNDIAYRSLIAGGTTLTDFGIGGTGITSKVFIGSRTEAATDRYMLPDSSLANAHLHLNGKGTGLVYVNGLATKIVAIGDWNMDANPMVSPFHTLPNYRKIISVSVVIRDDNDDIYYPLDAYQTATGNVDGGITNWWNAQITLFRRDGGIFDSATFNATGFNRGWLVITYQE